MVGAFACPECGRELEVEGLAPGGLIRCDDCATWIEIPFLPRGPSPRRRAAGRWSARDIRALRVGLAVLGIALVAAIAVRMVGSRLRSGREKVLADLITSADAAESSGQLGRALIELEAAVTRARATGSGRLGELLARRAGASLREATARLGGVGSLAPDRAVGEALTLLARARVDPALAPLADAIDEALDAQRLRQAEADLVLARAALEQGRAAEAFAVAERLHGRADHLQPVEVRRFRTVSEEVMEGAVSRSGVAFPPASGRFVFGSPEVYSPRIEGLYAEALRLKGYLPQPRRSPWRGLWDELAPFRAMLEVVETMGDPYLQTKNRTTDISGTMRLEYRGTSVWENRVSVTPQAFPPNLSAYAGGRSAIPDHRDPAVERRLYEASLDQFAEKFARKLPSLPDRDATARMP